MIEFIFTGIYGSPRWTVGKEIWKEHGIISHNMRLSLLITDDFNAMLNEEEKEEARGNMPVTAHCSNDSAKVTI